MKIYTIPLGGISGNCYLVEKDDQFLLIDTGRTPKRKKLVKILRKWDCSADNLRFIGLTHGDFDHTGNAAYLRELFQAQIGMHLADVEMVQKGDMFASRTGGNRMARFFINSLIGLRKKDRFEPDVLLEDGMDLHRFGFPFMIVAVPGHSAGSIAFYSEEGSLICGDLFTNYKKPLFNSNMDDPIAAQESLQRIRHLKVEKIYPGHGEPFLYADLEIP